jgi:Fe-S-cluster containining protein
MTAPQKLGKKKEKDTPAPWWAGGVRFECQGSGRCCVSRGEYGYVYMTLADRQRAAKAVGLATGAFTRAYCAKTEGSFHLRDGAGPECLFLEGGNRCGIYQGRPTQCRTWPFWPEVMSPKAWKADVEAYCPGVGKGRLWKKEDIERALAEQIKSERAGK